MDVSMKHMFNDTGEQTTITIQTKYKDLEVIRVPQHCYKCPVGLSCQDGEGCGRNVPWTDEDGEHRPDTCKLKQVDLADIISQLGITTQMTKEYNEFREKTTPKPLTEYQSCPNCGRFMGMDIEAYCHSCGQRILIGGIDEDKS